MKKRAWKLRGMLVLSAVAMALTLIFPQIGFLEWFAMIPMIWAAIRICEDDRTSLWTAFRSGFLTAFFFYFILYHWLVNLYPMDFIGMSPAASVAVIAAGWIGLPVLNAVAGGGVFLLFRLMHKSGILGRVPLLRPFAFSALWVIFEWCTTQTWMGVPWGRLAIGQIEMKPMLGVASLFGSYAVTFLIVAVNALIAEVVHSPRRTVVCGIVAAALFVGNLGFGLIWYNSEPKAENTVKAAVLQGNIGSHEKWGNDSLNHTKTVYGDMTRAVAKEGAELVIWPETALPFVLNQSKSLRNWISDLAEECDVTILVGALYDDAAGREYNVLYEVTPNGAISDTVYAKRHPVPFGEYVPMREVFMTLIPPLAELSALDDDLSAGTSSALFETKWGKIGSLICFDSIYEKLTLESVRDGAELMVLSSNDSWFYDSAAVYQHQAQAQLRAIESGRWFLRAANTGISSIITPRGDTVETVAPLTEGYIVETVGLTSSRTLYGYIGNLFVYFCMAFAAALAPIGYFLKRKQDSER